MFRRCTRALVHLRKVRVRNYANVDSGISQYGGPAEHAGLRPGRHEHNRAIETTNLRLLGRGGAGEQTARHGHGMRRSFAQS
jgi:hypothetical protein